MRARNIKPGFYRNADLAECSFGARLLAPALWMLADREGRLFDRPKQIKGECFPYDSVDVDPLLQELHDAGHITRYIVSGAKCIQVETDAEHQNPHHREKQSVIPAKSLGLGKGKPRAKPNLGASQPPLNPESLILNPESVPSEQSWLPAEEWAEFKKMRKAIKKPMTDYAEKLILAKLSRLYDEGQNIAAVLNESTKKNWQDVFAMKDIPAQDSSSDEAYLKAKKMVDAGSTDAGLISFIAKHEAKHA